MSIAFHTVLRVVYVMRWAWFVTSQILALGLWVRCRPGQHLIEEEGEQEGRVWTERVRENQKGLEVHKYILKVIFFLSLFISKIKDDLKDHQKYN